MKSKQLIEGAGAYDPDQLKIIGQAFEGAWARIEGGLGTRKAEIEHTRVTLAQTILKIAEGGVGDVKALQDEAIKRMFSDPTEL